MINVCIIYLTLLPTQDIFKTVLKISSYTKNTTCLPYIIFFVLFTNNISSYLHTKYLEKKAILFLHTVMKFLLYGS
jgi:hypothetical protein